jgi:hypothetical protein
MLPLTWMGPLDQTTQKANSTPPHFVHSNRPEGRPTMETDAEDADLSELADDNVMNRKRMSGSPLPGPVPDNIPLALV